MAVMWEDYLRSRQRKISLPQEIYTRLALSTPYWQFLDEPAQQQLVNYVLEHPSYDEVMLKVVLAAPSDLGEFGLQVIAG